MPGYVIHIATASEYMKKHKNSIKNVEEFINGTIEPDLTTKEDKKRTHFGNSSAEVILRNYLSKNNIDNDYNKGYFLHLVTDYIFYNRLLEYTSKEIYHDYDILNKYLIEKYNIYIPDKIRDSISFSEGETTILNKELAEKTIDIISSYSLEDIKKEILDTDYIEKWDKIRKLIRLDKK